jgi:hypothetical protein
MPRRQTLKSAVIGRIVQGCLTRYFGTSDPVAHELGNPAQFVAAIALMPRDARGLQSACEIFVEAKAEPTTRGSASSSSIPMIWRCAN